MDAHGAVELTLPTHQIAPSSTADDVRLAVYRTGRDLFGDRPGDAAARSWTTQQLTFLFAAAVLESLLVNLSSERLTAFGLIKHPSQVTTRQLARLYSPHDGLAGQAFEFAVSSAVNAAVPEAVDPIRAAFTARGLPATGDVGMILTGLEKLSRPEHRDHALRIVRDVLDGRTLRNGRPGRPSGAYRALEQASRRTWAQQRETEQTHWPATVDGARNSDRYRTAQARTEVSQLLRADALIYCGPHVLAASLKVNPSDVALSGWKDVPLWITSERSSSMPSGRDTHVTQIAAAVPTVVISLAHSWGNGAGALLHDTIRALQVALDALDHRRILSPLDRLAYDLWRELTRIRHEPLETAIAALRRAVDPHAIERGIDSEASLVAVADELVTVRTLNDDAIRAAHTATAAGWLTGQPHLFLPARDTSVRTLGPLPRERHTPRVAPRRTGDRQADRR